MKCKKVIFSGHAVQRMFDRSIDKNDILEGLKVSEVIATYSDDTPLPSFLVLVYEISKPMHIVVAVDQSSETCYIVTVYIPDLVLWNEDMKTRRIL